MKILLIKTESDYEAVDFENVYYGQDVTELIEKLDNGEELVGEAGVLPAEIYYVPEKELSRELVTFIRNHIQDYEHSKHTNFYLEGTKVGIK